MKNRPVSLAILAGIVVAGVSFAQIRKPADNNHTADRPAFGTQLVDRTTSTNSIESLRALDEAYAALADYVAPSVVHIRAEKKAGPDARGRLQSATGGEGSGVIYRSDGWIVTNDHVVNNFDEVTVVLNDGREFKGKVIETNDPTLDLAVVKIDATNLPAAKFGDSRLVRPGEISMAVGAPFGLENSVTIGHVSALGRANSVADQRMGGERLYSNMIQTDTPINMGNSGGPLINVDGQVIGINSAIFSLTGGSAGIGFSIPSNQVKLVADLLISKGKINRGYLGLAPTNLKPYQMKEMNLKAGALVLNVPNEGPAASAGIQKDDIIVRVGKQEISDQQDVRNAMLAYGPGSSVEVEYIRGGAHKTAQVKVSTPPTEQPAMQPKMRGNQNPQGDFDMPNIEDQLKRMRDQFEKGGGDQSGDVAPLRAGQAKLGIDMGEINAEARQKFGIPSNVTGVVVMKVDPDSVAAQYGLKPGTVISEFAGKTIKSGKDLADAMAGVKWGDSKRIKFSTYGKNSESSVSTDIRF